MNHNDLKITDLRGLDDLLDKGLPLADGAFVILDGGIVARLEYVGAVTDEQDNIVSVRGFTGKRFHA